MRGCDDIAYLHEQLGNRTPGEMQPIAEHEVPSEIARLIDGLPVGRASQPYRIDRGVAVLMVCQRREMPIDAELRQAALNRLRDLRLSRIQVDHASKLRQRAARRYSPR